MTLRRMCSASAFPIPTRWRIMGPAAWCWCWMGRYARCCVSSTTARCAAYQCQQEQRARVGAMLPMILLRWQETATHAMAQAPTTVRQQHALPCLLACMPMQRLAAAAVHADHPLSSTHCMQTVVPRSHVPRNHVPRSHVPRSHVPRPL